MDWVKLGIAVVTLVWAAATVRAELTFLRRELTDVKNSVREASRAVTLTLNDHGERISRIEGRIGGRR